MVGIVFHVIRTENIAPAAQIAEFVMLVGIRTAMEIAGHAPRVIIARWTAPQNICMTIVRLVITVRATVAQNVTMVSFAPVEYWTK